MLIRRERPARWAPAVLVPIGAIVALLVISVVVTLAIHDAVAATAAADLVVVALCWGLRRRFARRSGPDRRPAPLASPTTLLVLLVSTFPVWVVCQAVTSWMLEHGYSTGYGSYDSELRAGNPVLLVVLMVLIAPLTEELLLRGVVYAWLRTKLGPSIAATVSATTFALLHGTVVHLVFAFVLGWFLAMLFEITARLWVPVAAHAGFNLASVLLGPVTGVLTSPVLLLVQIVLIACLLVMLRATVDSTRSTPSI